MIRPGKSRGGVTLTEVLVAVAVMALAVLPIISVFSSAGTSLEQSMPYTQAVFLSDKTLEEARLGTQEDPYCADQFVVDKLGAARASVVKGLHPMFEVLEDSAPPWGRIEPKVDTAIDPAVGALYRQTEPIAMSLAAGTTLNAATGMQEASLQVAMDWMDLRGVAMRPYRISTPLKVWQTLSAVETATPAMTPADLATVMSQHSGGDPAKLQAYATLLILGSAADALRASTASQLQQAGLKRLAATTPASQIAADLAIANLSEAGAAGLLALLLQMKDPVATLAQGLPPGSLGSPEPPFAERKAVVESVSNAMDGFFEALRGALVVASQVASAPRLNAGVRLWAHERVWRCARMESLVLPWPSTAPLDTLLKDLVEFYRARMPHVMHRFAHEQPLVATPQTGYPLYGSTQDVRAMRDALPQAEIDLLLYPIGKTPPSPGPPGAPYPPPGSLPGNPGSGS